MDKSSLRGRLKEARALIAESKHAEALQLLQEPPPTDYMSLALCGLCAGEAGDRRAAIDYYRSAAALDSAKMPAWQGAYKLLRDDVGQWRTLDADEIGFMLRCVGVLRDDTNEAAKRSELGRHRLAGHLAMKDYEQALALCRDADDVDMWRACLGVVAKGDIGEAHGRMLSEAYKSMRRVLDADILIGELRFRYKYSADVSPVLECAAYVCDLDGLASAGGAALAAALLLQECVARRKFLSSPAGELFMGKLHELQPVPAYVGVMDALARRQSARAAQLLDECGEDFGQDASPYRLTDLLQYLVAVHTMQWPDVLDRAAAIQSIGADCAWARGGHLLRLDRARAMYFISGPHDLDKAEKLLSDAECAESALVAFYLAVARADIPLAERRLGRAVELCEDDEAAVCAARAWLLLHSGQLDDAVNAIQTHESASGTPDYWQHYVRGRCLYARGNYTAATLAAFLHCAKAEPCFAPAYHYLGKTYLMLEQSNVPKATRCLQRAHHLAPYAEEMSGDLSDVYGVSAEHQAAHLELLRAAVARHAGATWAHKRLAYRLQAVGTPSATDESIGLLQRALSTDDGDIAAWTCLADAYCERGSTQAAVACYAKASSLRPADAYSAVRLGELSTGDAALALPARFPRYVPALLVAGRAALAAAIAAFGAARFCRCAVELHAAVSHVVRALEIDVRLCALWWHTARCLCLAADVAHSEPMAAGGQLRSALESLCARVRVLLGVRDDAAAFDEASLYALAEKCCMASVRLAAADESLSPCLPPLWHDLAVVAMQRAVHLKRAGDADGARSSRRLCERCARAALRSCGQLGDSARFIQARCWLVLGTAIVLLDERVDARAAAHCFAAATHLDQSCARAWTALGLLYMRHGRHTAANSALSRAQAVEPEYGRCWAAQAMLAAGMDEHRHLAKDLFRHACELREWRPSTAAQYARLVLADPPATVVESSLLARHAAAVCARDAGDDQWRRLLAVARHLEGGGRTRHAALNAALARLMLDGRPVDATALGLPLAAYAPLAAALSAGRIEDEADLDTLAPSPPSAGAQCFLSPGDGAPHAAVSQCSVDSDRLALLHDWLRARLVHGIPIEEQSVAGAAHSFPYDSAVRAVHFISHGNGDFGSHSFWPILADVEPELRALLLLEVCRRTDCDKIRKAILATVRMLLPWVPLASG